MIETRKELLKRIQKYIYCTFCKPHRGENQSRSSKALQKGWKVKRKTKYKVVDK